MHKNIENGKVYKLITTITLITDIKVSVYVQSTTKQEQQAFLWILKICMDNKIILNLETSIPQSRKNPNP